MTLSRTVYLDWAATSWPKPPCVGDAMGRALSTCASPGRSGHSLSIEASRVLADARMAIADFFEVPEPDHVAFTKNITEALNVALLGLLRKGDHVVTTSIEHNSVMRPLRHLEKAGIHIHVVECTPDGRLSFDGLSELLKLRPRLVVATHASNVLGTILPIRQIADLAHSHGSLVVLDAAQTAGVLPVSMTEMGVDVLAFTGHKGLLGPTGTGGLCLSTLVEVEPLIRGGTGSASELETQPEFLPDALESGTPNVVGIAGLLAAVQYVDSTGAKAIREHEVRLGARIRDALASLPNVTQHGPVDPEDSIGVISISIEGLLPSEVGLALEQVFGVQTRIGLHCAPAAHQTAGTYPVGTTRVSWGYFTTDEDIDVAIEGLTYLSAKVRR